MWVWWVIGGLALLLAVYLVVSGKGRAPDPTRRIRDRRRQQRRHRH